MYTPYLLHRFVRAALLACLVVTHTACAAPEKNLVPMVDGVKLVTDVYLPEGQGPWPVILARSPYGRGMKEASDYAKDGYAVVVQDIRGTGESEGEKYIFHPDGWRSGLQDGADTVAWIKAQAWCDGKIGTWGGSALGITQQLLAGSSTDVAGQAIEVAPSDFYAQTVFRGGVWSKNLVEGWLTAIGQPHLIKVYKEHPRYDEFWSYYNFAERAPKMTAPALFIGGWYDIFNQGTIDSFVTREQQGGVGARGNNYLVMKWSPHGADTTLDYKHNENRFDLKISELRDKFYRATLKGDASALVGVPKVHYYVMGDDAPGSPGNEWRTADTWPPYATKPTRLYLDTAGGLSLNEPGAPGFREFAFDPKDPVPTMGGQNLLAAAGPYDQRKVSARKDVLQFNTSALEKPVEITGRVTVKLKVSSDAPDTDFTAKLVDVFPDGREILLLDHIRRVKSREGYDRVAPLLTGQEQTVEIDIDLWSIAWIFNTGHKIGLHISSSNFPRFELNPNTGADFPEEGAELRVAHNRVHAASTSYIELPVRE